MRPFGQYRTAAGKIPQTTDFVLDRALAAGATASRREPSA